MARSNPSRKKPAAKKRNASARKASPAKRKVVAAKSKSVKSVTKAAAAKGAKKTVAKKPAAKPAVKAAPKVASKSSAPFAKTNKPVTPMRARPLSPHLTIYRPQITSMLSILHRGTGVVLYIAAFAVAWLIINLGYGQSAFASSIETLNTVFGIIAVYIVLFCLFYHLCNGIRHLAWDIGEGFELPTVTLSGLLVLVASCSLTAAIWFILHPQFLRQLPQ